MVLPWLRWKNLLWDCPGLGLIQLQVAEGIGKPRPPHTHGSSFRGVTSGSGKETYWKIHTANVSLGHRLELMAFCNETGVYFPT